ncbi:hypothetical protein CPB83DRAFT_947604 [Crepidotus variabilis]|uniref:DUF6589 domain-containing protein n=1 Tax=Crepidotus variabilis TaxID=179855 RepID=A0A9P6JKS9_9AGAR|nr:hypothetical protein CPB83DRAFT_947604 [Crepidotus variabilis]
MESSYGLPDTYLVERAYLYSTDHPYCDLKYARPAITSFATQLVKEKALQEIKKVVRKDGGLHTFTTRKNDAVARHDPGPDTFTEVMKIYQKEMPVSWDILLSMGTTSEDKERGRRSPELVVTHALSSLAYSRHLYAKLLPLEKGILNFACSANQHLVKYDSRVGNAPSYHSIYDALKKLAAHDASLIKKVTQDPTKSWIIRIDNVQHYVRPRNFRIGREATMKIGTAGTAFEFVGFSPTVVDLESKRQILALNKRKDFTMKELRNLVDTAYISKVCALQWLRILINYVPALSKYKSAFKKLHSTIALKQVLPVKKTRLYPLPTNGRNETVTAELRHALVDFITEMGYSKENLNHLLHIGGDGLTFERMVLLKLYMQFHDSPFECLEWLQPFLEIWHACWTDLSRIYEAHWGNLLSNDPSSLGNNANHLKRKAPSNLKKVDYYPYSELAYQILDARVLDCWRVLVAGKDGDLIGHFEAANANKNLPALEELHSLATTLFARYGHPHAFEFAIDNSYRQEETRVPLGDPWTPPPADNSSNALLTKHKKKQTKQQAKKTSPGDQSLAESCRFLYDATVSRELVYATSDGDIGRAYEILKSMIFTFAGSSHTKYMNYLLEMVCDLELESSPELRNAFLANWFVNPSGKPNGWMAGDKFQEQLQDEMYEHIGRKDRGFDEDYLRQVIAPNAYRFVLVKKAVTESLGLAQRHGKHIDPQTNAETAKLMEIYKAEQLHLFRSGRTYGGDAYRVDDLGRGMEKLTQGKLASWIQDTIRCRFQAAPSIRVQEELESEIEQLDNEVEFSTQNDIPQTRGRILQLSNGGLVFEHEVDDDEELEPLEIEESEGVTNINDVAMETNDEN